MTSLKDLTQNILNEEVVLRQGGGESGRERQQKLGRLNARERLGMLLDEESDFLELELFAAYGMYQEWGGLPAAGVITGIGKVAEHLCMIIANDATVKAGAMFPQSVKKVLRAQKIAEKCRLPILYLVDSSGIFLPLQDEVFPDEDDFGRIFRNNAVFSANGIPQFAAIMGNCIAGGGYLPVLCDQILMTKGSGLYLAGPALVKAAIGQITDSEELGGVEMHAKISGTVDYEEEDDESCLKKLRMIVSKLPEQRMHSKASMPAKDPQSLYDIVSSDSQREYDIHDVLDTIVDAQSFVEYKKDFGRTIVAGFANIHGIPVGIVASQRKALASGRGEIEIGGVLYTESADKAARFVLDCNQMALPIIFLQDVLGFMVGKEAEASGIIKSGAKLVNAISNSVVPKITVVIGNSFGAGNYALCGKAYDPHFIFAWPNARYAVMGAEQAVGTLQAIQAKKGNAESLEEVEKSYKDKMDIKYGAARGWIDAIIAPHKTREVLRRCLECAQLGDENSVPFKTGVMQT